MREPESGLLGVSRLAAGLPPYAESPTETLEPGKRGGYLPAKYPRWRRWLEDLLLDKTTRLAKATRPAWKDGSILASVEVVGADGAVQDVCALMIRAGYALAAGEHDQAEAYAAMEQAARAEGAGILRRTGD